MAAGPSETDSAIEHKIRIAAAPETVFAYFTDPAKMVQWMGAEATLDPRPGGVCRIVFQPPQPRGEFVEVDPYQRIVLHVGLRTEVAGDASPVNRCRSFLHSRWRRHDPAS